jgi:hypothetical protein
MGTDYYVVWDSHNFENQILFRKMDYYGNGVNNQGGYPHKDGLQYMANFLSISHYQIYHPFQEGQHV